ncbi:MAG: poly-gamma-glutamate biosynthesis protein PgsC/CapC [Microcoleus vaginatus WJT46-NPBG5]|jgi:hypothetical protein|nr:poly-gamma-glutamate biosynthesis protein PgsC/CapC [Microcoleus vaginatus WJT46-NPBG5]
MFELPNTPEIHRLALNVGAFVAIAYRDRYGVIPGGVIVPGFIIVLSLLSPIWCITSLALSFFVYVIYKRFLQQTSYKRRTPMYILAFLSLAIANSIGLIYIKLGWLYPSLDSLSGTLLPAVIAFTLTKQKLNRVVRAIIITTLITFVILLGIYSIGASLFNIDFDTLRAYYPSKEILKIHYHLFQFYVALGVSYLIYRFKDIRSGGYMVAPVAAALFVKPTSAILFLIGCITVYLVVQTICQLTLLIGLKRYVVALFFSTLFVWTTEFLFINLGFDILPFQGGNLFVIIAMMSYVNDSILYANKKVINYMTLNILTALIALFVANTVSAYLVPLATKILQ